jgi:hypothetical protein
VKLRRDPGPSDSVQLLLKAAQSHLAYASDLGGRNVFGAKTGYDSQPWAGAFVDVCLRDAGFKNQPSFMYTPAALAEYFRSGLVYRVPLAGDIAIYNFSSNTGHAADVFGMPHCGIVTDVREFSNTGRFITVEGNTLGSTNYQQKDGVHQKVRHGSDVLAFCRPLERPTGNFIGKMLRLLDHGRTKFNGEDLLAIEEAARVPLTIKLSTEIKHGDRNKRIETIQLALATVTDLRGAEPGKWDASTAAACARYQRVIGFVGKDASGLPNLRTLKRLARETGLFNIDA